MHFRRKLLLFILTASLALYSGAAYATTYRSIAVDSGTGVITAGEYWDGANWQAVTVPASLTAADTVVAYGSSPALTITGSGASYTLLCPVTGNVAVTSNNTALYVRSIVDGNVSSSGSGGIYVDSTAGSGWVTGFISGNLSSPVVISNKGGSGNTVLNSGAINDVTSVSVVSDADVRNNSVAATISNVSGGTVISGAGTTVSNYGQGSAVSGVAGPVSVADGASVTSAGTGATIYKTTGSGGVTVSNAYVGNTGGGVAIYSSQPVTLENNAKVLGGLSGLGNKVITGPVSVDGGSNSAVLGASNLTVQGTALPSETWITNNSALNATISGTTGSVYIGTTVADGAMVVNSHGGGAAIQGTGVDVMVGGGGAASVALGGRGIVNTGRDVEIAAKSAVTGSSGDAIYQTGRDVTVNGTAMSTGGIAINSTGRNVTVGNNAMVSGDKGGISGTGGYVLIGSGATVRGGTGTAVTGTTGNVIVNPTNASTVTITGATGIDGTGGDVLLKKTNLTAVNNGIEDTTGNIDVADSTVTSQNGTAIAHTTGTGGVTVRNSTITGRSGGIADTSGSVGILGASAVTASAGLAIANTYGSVQIGDGTGNVSIGGTLGIYNTYGNLTVNGNGTATTTITGTAGPAIMAVAGAADIKKATLDGSMGGLINAAGNVSVADSSILGGTGDAIMASPNGNADVTVSNSSLVTSGAGSGSGVVADNRKAVSVSDTQIRVGGSGIMADNAASLSVTGSAPNGALIVAGQDGIAATGVSGSVVIRNASIGTGSNGIDIANASGTADITGTSVTAGGNGINASGSETDGLLRITDTSVKANSGYGIDVSGKSGAVISGLSVTAAGANGTGIVAGAANNLVLETKSGRNTITADKTGIDATGGTAAVIRANAQQPADTLYITAGQNDVTGNGINAGGSSVVSSDVNLSIVTTTEDSNGLNANGHGSRIAAAKNVAAEVAGNGANAISATNYSVVTVKGESDLTLRGTDEHGVNAEKGSLVELAGGSYIKAAGYGNTAGLYAIDSSKIKAMGITSIDIATTGDGVGIAANSSDVAVDKIGLFKVAGDAGATGLYSVNGGHVTAGFASDLEVKSSGGLAMGINTYGPAPSAVVFSGMKDMKVTADHSAAYGISASGSTVSGDLANMNVEAYLYAAGIYAQNGAQVSTAMTGDMDVTSTSNSAEGINAIADGARVLVSGLGALNVAGNGGPAVGIRAADGEASVDMQEMNVSAAASAAGVEALISGKASAALNGNMDISSQLGEARGFYGEDSSTIDFSGVKELSVTSGADKAKGIYAISSSTVRGDAESVTVEGAGDTSGLVAWGNSKAVLSMAGDMSVASTGDGNAMGAQAYGSSSTEITGGLGGLQVQAADGTAMGFNAFGNSSLDVTMGGDVDVSTEHGSAYGASAASNGKLTLAMAETGTRGDVSVTSAAGGSVYGVAADGGSAVDFSGMKDLTARAGGGSASGLFARNASTIDGSLGNITVEATGNAVGLDVQNGGRTSLAADGDLTAASTVNGSAMGIIAANSGRAEITTGLGDLSVRAAGGTATGIYATSGSRVDVAMNGDFSSTSDNGGALGAVALSGTNIELAMAEKGYKGDFDVSSSVTGDATGLYAGESSRVIFSGMKDMSVAAEGGGARAVIAVNGSTVSGDAESIKATASGLALGVQANYGSTAALVMDGDLDVTSSASGGARGIDSMNGSIARASGLEDLSVTANTGDVYGIRTWNGSSADLTMNGNAEVNTGAGSAYGVQAAEGAAAVLSMTKGENSGNFHVESVSDGEAQGVAAVGTGASVLFSGMKDLTVAALDGGAAGVSASDNGSVTGELDNLYAYSENESYGVAAYTASVSLDAAGGITAKTDTGNGGYGSAYGLMADENGRLSVTAGDLLLAESAYGTAFGIYAYNSSVVNAELNGGISALTGYGSSYGVSTRYGSRLYLDISGDIFAGAADGTARGIYARGSSIVEVASLDNIYATAKNGNAYGISARSGGTVNAAMSGIIEAETEAGQYGDTARGIYADGGTAAVNGATAITATSITSGDGGYGGSAHGIDAENGGLASVEMSGPQAGILASVEGRGGAAYGISAWGNSAVDVVMPGEGSSIRASAAGMNSRAYGISAVNNNGGYGKAAGAAGASVMADGLQPGETTAVSVSDAEAISARADGTAFGIYAFGSEEEVHEYPNTSQVSGAGAVDVTVDGDTSVYAAGGDASTAIAAYGKAAVTLTSEARREIVIDSASSEDSVLKIGGGAEISFNNALVHNAGSGAAASLTALSGEDGEYVDGSGTVNASASYLLGDVFQRAWDGELTLNLRNSSALFGAANVVPEEAESEMPAVDAADLADSAEPTSKISINIDGAGNGDANTTNDSSLWVVTGDSDMRGTLTNDGIAAFLPGSTFKTISAGRLMSSEGKTGLYVLNATLDNQEKDANGRQADQITASDAGSNAGGVVQINDIGSVPTFQARMEQPLIVVKQDESTNFRLRTNSQGYDNYELGSWRYVLKSGTVANADESFSTEWYLENADLSALASTALNAVVMPDIWYLETNALYSQLGDFNAGREKTTAWGHALYNKLRWDNAIKFRNDAANFTLPYENEATQEFYGLAGGLDWRLNSEKNQWFAGFMVGYGEGDLDMQYGDGSLDSFHAGLYTVCRTEGGWYLAGLLKYNRYKTDMTARPLNGYAAYKSDYSQDGWGLSVMAGKQFTHDNGWFVEPQIELGWHRTGGADYTLGGMPVEVEGASSLRGRVGVGIGRKYLYDDGRTLDLFFKASLVHEFDGETDVNIYTDSAKTKYDPFTVDYSGTWGQFKAGFNYYNGKNFNAHAAVTYENGGDRESPLGLELGLSWLTGPKPVKEEAEEKQADSPAGESSETQTEGTKQPQ